METRAGSPCITIRADASTGIGTGHVMRCLTLAEELRQRGASVHFLCRAHPGHMGEVISARGFALTLLPPPVMSFDADDYATWLGAPAGEDARQTMEALQGMEVAWLIVDHYAIDQHWEQLLRPHTAKILVIDDLANRHHDCDLLLDQTYGRCEEQYGPLVSEHAVLLLGSQYALLRAEFARWRTYSLKRRTGEEFRHLLVTMGGVDAANHTSLVLTALRGCELPHDLKITVILGHGSPHVDEVRRHAASLPWQTEVRCGVGNMAELLAGSDLCIGAAGSTTWERCCLGVPSVVYGSAANQREILAQLGEHGAMLEMRSMDSLCTVLMEAVARRENLSLRAREVCDQLGVSRVADHLVPVPCERQDVVLRRVQWSDARQLYEWQIHPETRRHSRNSAPPTWQEHCEWLKDRLRNPSSFMYLIEQSGLPVGTVRIDLVDSGKDLYETSISLDPDHYGQGFAQQALVAINRAFAQLSLLAHIKPENAASVKLFSRCGYRQTDETHYLREARHDK
ncbi:UDP-2,4-diacetamido-2,4,6-trideoxy-beta-L-altropyranose hydrolase [Desulfurispirillum indicum]|uniref:UDP-2,4-diacetamido-2,4, 6-trideoxy-beta-L-altropyranose hydrolase n=1 Tax=Desulfurispirillum indicum TaxID=936456 RepID=UPI001CFBDCAA|nr:UDP-2,4-diacetamido-2,4,6-trideoxy-beta-L-altropyranose hydrolase [Desulfurispirillum indicum]UCZ57555.1 UDP-2,4-diacetamido-2,4,6-trideoxy-beta-L-altropyranose hydrolase [Desulfurispirillum indicum]